MMLGSNPYKMSDKRASEQASKFNSNLFFQAQEEMYKSMINDYI